MKLEGSLDAFGLSDVLQLLGTTAKTGALRLDHGPKSAVIHLVDGAIASATLHSDGRLGVLRRLVGQGLIDEVQVASAAATAAGTGDGLVDTVVADGAIDVDVARSVTGDLAIDALVEILTWHDGAFAFGPDETAPDDVGLRVAPASLLADAQLRAAEWSDIRAVVAAGSTVPVMSRIDSDVLVSPDVWPLLALIDGRRTVDTLAVQTGRSAFAVTRALAGAVDDGLVELHVDAESASAEVRGREDILAMLASAEGGAASESDVDALQESTFSPSADGVHLDEADADFDDAAPADELDMEPPKVTSTVVTVETGSSGSAEPLTASRSIAQAPSARGPGGRAASAQLRSPDALLGGAHVAGDVVPPRPEPFLPHRQPEHGDDVGGMGLEIVGANAIVTGPALNPLERPASAASDVDLPSGAPGGVNRSMVLRLIAGVRGL